MKRWLALIAAWAVLWSSLPALGESGRYSGVFFDTFDTVVTLIGYAESKDAFENAFTKIHQRFLYLHKLYDGYNAYDGVENIYTLNQKAGTAPVKVAPELMELLVFCRQMEDAYPGKVNIAMGRVLAIWHDYREAGLADPDHASLPPIQDLEAAAEHMDLSNLILNQEESTVFYADPEMTLDVGAVAKGFAAQLAGQEAASYGLPSFLMSAGGNMIAGEAPLDGRTAWSIGIQDPLGAVWDAEATLDSVYIQNGAVVSSGDYQRYYLVDGKKYHHIIDPVTLMPAEYMAQVTVVANSSAEADFFSTALFLMPVEEGLHLVESLEEVEAMWVLKDGTIAQSSGFAAISRKGGATNLTE